MLLIGRQQSAGAFGGTPKTGIETADFPLSTTAALTQAMFSSLPGKTTWEVSTTFFCAKGPHQSKPTPDIRKPKRQETPGDSPFDNSERESRSFSSKKKKGLIHEFVFSSLWLAVFKETSPKRENRISLFFFWGGPTKADPPLYAPPPLGPENDEAAKPTCLGIPGAGAHSHAVASGGGGGDGGALG